MSHLLTELQQLDAQDAFQNYGTRLPYAFVKGEGARMWDSNGAEYLDFLGGIAVTILGHNHPKVTAAIAHQASQILHTSNFFYIEPQVRLAQKLSEMSGGMRAVFCNSGAEANEAAIKIARRYAYDRGDTERVEIVTLEKSFHGRTLGALAATIGFALHQIIDDLVFYPKVGVMWWIVLGIASARVAASVTTSPAETAVARTPP